MQTEKNEEALLSRIDPKKRAFIGKLMRTAVFATPLVASFAMNNMSMAAPLPGNGSLNG